VDAPQLADAFPSNDRKGGIMIRSISIFAIMLLPLCVAAQDAGSRHDEGGTTGSNGVKQHVIIQLNKTVPGKDSAFIQLDLGDHRYSSVKPDLLIKERPIILMVLGSVPAIEGKSDARGRIVAAQYVAKLVKNGGGIQIMFRKATLTNLLSDLSGKGEHAQLTITISDNHPPAPTAPAPAAETRHAHSLFSKEFELDIKENGRVLKAKGG
jgi:hypothetical protein